ncbi:MAG: demethylmenaquinone methyltransferase [Bacillota bacterium]|nr:demethylmenaquinone methyltransferase [Bacillota bacterium]
MSKLPSKEEKASYVQGMFDSIAARYDLLNSIMSFGFDKSWRRFAVKRAEPKAGGNCLDICCGTGMITMELAKVVGNDGKVTGLDFSENMLKVAQSNIEEFPLKDSITLIQGNAMELPFPDNSFDCVTVGWGLRNVPDIYQVVKEMRRVIIPGGKVVSLDMAKPTAPVFKQGYWLYFDKLVPLMGKIWAGKKSAYDYLHNSSVEFPAQAELAQIFAKVGLQETRYHNLLGGVVAVVEGRK